MGPTEFGGSVQMRAELLAFDENEVDFISGRIGDGSPYVCCMVSMLFMPWIYLDLDCSYLIDEGGEDIQWILTGANEGS